MSEPLTIAEDQVQRFERSRAGRLATLLRLIRAAAEAQEPCPTDNQMLDAVHCGNALLHELLGHLVRTNVITITTTGTGSGRQRVIAAVDGSWRTSDTVRRRNSASPFHGRVGNLPPRRCLACRRPFAPRHRFNFLCCSVEEV